MPESPRRSTAPATKPIFDGTALGCIAVCCHCGYACQLRRHRWPDPDTGGWHEGDFWDHFVTNVFTCHTAEPKPGVRDVRS